MSIAVSALRLMPKALQVNTLIVGVHEGSCSRETAISDASELGVVNQLIDELRSLDSFLLDELAAPFVDPHGKAWCELSDAELRQRRTWCMRSAHHVALNTEIARRKQTGYVPRFSPVDGRDYAYDVPF